MVKSVAVLSGVAELVGEDIVGVGRGCAVVVPAGATGATGAGVGRGAGDVGDPDGAATGRGATAPVLVARIGADPADAACGVSKAGAGEGEDVAEGFEVSEVVAAAIDPSAVPMAESPDWAEVCIQKILKCIKSTAVILHAANG